MFDYLFYRFYDIYKRKEGDTSAFSATAAISFIQILIISSIILSISFITNIILSVNFLTPMVLAIGETLSKFIIVLLSSLLFICNYLKYRKSLDEIISKYSKSELNRKLKMWLIFLIMPVAMIFPFALRYILKLLF